MKNEVVKMAASSVDKIVEQTTGKLTYGGAAVSVIGGFSANEIAAYGGLLVAFLTFIVNWYYKYKADKRAEDLEIGYRRGDIPTELRKVNNDGNA